MIELNLTVAKDNVEPLLELLFVSVDSVACVAVLSESENCPVSIRVFKLKKVRTHEIKILIADAAVLESTCLNDLISGNSCSCPF